MAEVFYNVNIDLNFISCCSDSKTASTFDRSSTSSSFHVEHPNDVMFRPLPIKPELSSNVATARLSRIPPHVPVLTPDEPGNNGAKFRPLGAVFKPQSSSSSMMTTLMSPLSTTASAGAVSILKSPLTSAPTLVRQGSTGSHTGLWNGGGLVETPQTPSVSSSSSVTAMPARSQHDVVVSSTSSSCVAVDVKTIPTAVSLQAQQYMAAMFRNAGTGTPLQLLMPSPSSQIITPHSSSSSSGNAAAAVTSHPFRYVIVPQSMTSESSSTGSTGSCSTTGAPSKLIQVGYNMMYYNMQLDETLAEF